LCGTRNFQNCVKGVVHKWQHDIQYNGIRHNDTQDYDIEHNNKKMTLTVTTLSLMALNIVLLTALCRVLFMLSVANKPIILIVFL
jgi:hypothetical protein